jgi:hypothetical protein
LLARPPAALRCASILAVSAFVGLAFALRLLGLNVERCRDRPEFAHKSLFVRSPAGRLFRQHYLWR